MSQKGVSKKAFYAVAILCIAVLIGLNVSVYEYIQQNAQLQEKEQQILDLQTVQTSAPDLVGIDLKCSADSETSTLHVKGYVVNVGDAKANNCTVHVNVSGSDDELSTSIDSIEPGTYKQVDVEFPFSSNGIVAFNTYLKWTN